MYGLDTRQALIRHSTEGGNQLPESATGDPLVLSVGIKNGFLQYPGTGSGLGTSSRINCTALVAVRRYTGPSQSHPYKADFPKWSRNDWNTAKMSLSSLCRAVTTLPVVLPKLRMRSFKGSSRLTVRVAWYS